MGSEASTLMIKYFKKMKTDPSLPIDTTKQTKTFKKIFSILDKDGNGTIDGQEIPLLIKELRKAMESAGKRNVSESEIKQILRVADQNRDGMIDFSEFCGMMFSISRVCV